MVLSSEQILGRTLNMSVLLSGGAHYSRYFELKWSTYLFLSVLGLSSRLQKNTNYTWEVSFR